MLHHYVGQRVYCTRGKDLQGFVTEWKVYTVLSVDYMYDKHVIEITDDKGNPHFLDRNRFNCSIPSIKQTFKDPNIKKDSPNLTWKR